MRLRLKSWRIVLAVGLIFLWSFGLPADGFRFAACKGLFGERGGASANRYPFPGV
ncbi:MAG: hypothetical protein KatS3mg045_1327 [Bellilinea sp.]|nr:MAG: hypothetical protein KatS3mg045_1327 [Bellilinea sp.]